MAEKVFKPLTKEQLDRRYKLADELMATGGNKRPESMADLVYNSLSRLGGVWAHNRARSADKESTEAHAKRVAELLGGYEMDPARRARLTSRAQSHPLEVEQALLGMDLRAMTPQTAHERAQIALGEDRNLVAREGHENQRDIAAAGNASRKGIADGKNKTSLEIARMRARQQAAAAVAAMAGDNSKPTAFEVEAEKRAAKGLEGLDASILEANKQLSKLSNIGQLLQNEYLDAGPTMFGGDVKRRFFNAISGGNAYAKSIAANESFDAEAAGLQLSGMEAIKGAASDKDSELVQRSEMTRNDSIPTLRRKHAARSIIQQAIRDGLTRKREMTMSNQGPLTTQQTNDLIATFDAEMQRASEALGDGGAASQSPAGTAGDARFQGLSDEELRRIAEGGSPPAAPPSQAAPAAPAAPAPLQSAPIEGAPPVVPGGYNPGPPLTRPAPLSPYNGSAAKREDVIRLLREREGRQ